MYHGYPVEPHVTNMIPCGIPRDYEMNPIPGIGRGTPRDKCDPIWDPMGLWSEYHPVESQGTNVISCEIPYGRPIGIQYNETDFLSKRERVHTPDRSQIPAS